MSINCGRLFSFALQFSLHGTPACHTLFGYAADSDRSAQGGGWWLFLFGRHMHTKGKLYARYFRRRLCASPGGRRQRTACFDAHLLRLRAMLLFVHCAGAPGFACCFLAG
jgi:hypothetical protein